MRLIKHSRFETIFFFKPLSLAICPAALSKKHVEGLLQQVPQRPAGRTRPACRPCPRRPRGEAVKTAERDPPAHGCGRGGARSPLLSPRLASVGSNSCEGLRGAGEGGAPTRRGGVASSPPLPSKCSSRSRSVVAPLIDVYVLTWGRRPALAPALAYRYRLARAKMPAPHCSSASPGKASFSKAGYKNHPVVRRSCFSLARALRSQGKRRTASGQPGRTKEKRRIRACF